MLLSSMFFFAGPVWIGRWGLALLRRPMLRGSRYDCSSWRSWQWAWFRIYRREVEA